MPFKTRIRSSLIIAICLTVLISSVPAQWRKLETGTLSWLHAIEFIDEKKGWAGGTNGSLIATDDGGATWKRAAFPTRDAIRDIVFTDARNGWLLCERSDRPGNGAGNASYLLKTEDGGTSWTQLEFTASIDRMVRIVAAPSGEGFAVGEGGSLAGIPFGIRVPAKIGLPVRFLILAGAWIGPSRIVLVGGGGTSIVSDDLGSTWQVSRSTEDLSETRLSSVYFSSATTGWAVGNNGTILTSVNGGRSWAPAKRAASDHLLDVRFVDGRTGFAVGENGTILRSDDSGANWARVKSPTPHRLGRLAFAGRRAFAAGFGGTIVAADIDAR